ncbi:hypothetical protein AB1M95_02565 [Sulfitobacter sp. LCG007]
MAVMRHILAVAVLAAVAACAPTPSIRTVGDAGALDVRDIQVDANRLDLVIKGRQLERSRAQLKQDVTAALEAELRPVSVKDGTPVVVAVELVDLHLANTAERFVAQTSHVTTMVSVTEIGTGRVVVPATEVSGNTDNFRAIGVVGAATTLSVEEDYRGALRGYAKTVRAALFGSDQ